MPNENSPPRQRPPQSAIMAMASVSYLDWAAVLAGSIFAVAISFLLISFGAGLGLSLTSPYRGEGVSAAWLAIAAGIWFAWVMVTSFGAGGYIAGRMRRPVGDASAVEVEMRDGTHGLLVWATGALVSTILFATGVGGLVTAGSAAIGSAVGTVADVTMDAVSPDYFAHVLLRSSEVRPPAEDGTVTPGIDPAIQEEIAVIITRTVSSGDMEDRDRAYLAQVIAANSDLDVAAARIRVEDVNAEIDDARTAAFEAVEMARVAGVVFGFIAAATLLIGAIAAFFAAAAGGRHRDEAIDASLMAERR